MKSISSPLRAHLDLTVTSLATIWRITRTDGEEFYLTDHDVDIPFDDGDGLATYLSEEGYLRTAIANNVGLAVDNMDMRGVFSTSGVLEEELRAGVFDFADVRVSTVNWQDLTQGALKLRRGHMGQVKLSPNGIFDAELRGLVSPLSQSIITNYQAECRTDLGSAACKVPIDPSASMPRSTAVEQNDAYRVATKAATGIDYSNVITNPSFEQDTVGIDTTSIDGWTIVTGEWDVTAAVSGLSPSHGTYFLLGSDASASSTLLQIIDLSVFDLSVSEIDAGNVTADFSCKRANTDITDTGQVVVSFLDGAQAPISTMYDTTQETILPVDTWATRSASGVTLPATTRYVKILITANNETGGQGRSAFDDFDLTFSDSASTNTYYDLYENVYYECSIAGTTAVSAPVFDTTVGNKTVDGTAEWITKTAWTRDGNVVDVDTAQKMRIDVTDVRAVDNWFNYGAIEFESGPNTGLVREIKFWTETDGVLEMFITTPFPVRPGVKVKLYPGCDKRADTCRELFKNMINFQGEPFVPGTDLMGGS